MLPQIVYFGIDVSKNSLDLYGKGKHRKFENHSDSIEDLIQWIQTNLNDGETPQVILEPTGGYEKCLITALARTAVSFSCPNPRRVREFARAQGKLAKTDKIDAAILALFGETFQPKCDSLNPETIDALRSLHRRLRQLINMNKMEKTHREHTDDPRLKKRLLAHMNQLEKEIQKVQQKMEQIIEQDSTLREKRQALENVKGVGSRTAIVLLTHMPELGALNRKAICSLAGLAPVTRESGQWRGRRTPGPGRHLVRKALYMAR